jgi:hypothetical protein
MYYSIIIFIIIIVLIIDLFGARNILLHHF